MQKTAPKVSDFETRAQWQAAAWDWLLDILTNRSVAGIRELLELITSPPERRLLSMRAAVHDRLLAGISYRKIGRELWVSPTLISWVKKSAQSKNYKSSWDKTKVDIEINKAKKWRATEKPLPVHYRNTKYGRSKSFY